MTQVETFLDADKLAEAFGKIMASVECDPLGSLRKWRDVLMPHIERMGAGAGPRRFERLASAVLKHADADLSDEVNEEISTVRSELAVLVAAKHQFAKAFSFGFGAGVGRVGRREQLARRPSMPELRDIFQLEERLADKPEGMSLSWLLKGLDDVRANPVTRHLAFRPLRLFPGSRIIEQLADALIAGEQAGARVPGILNEAIFSHLKRDKGAPPENLERDLDLWRLLTALKPNATTIAEARSYLLWLSQTNAERSIQDALVDAVCQEVAATTPITGAQTAFFLWLKRNGVFWRLELDRHLEAAETAERNSNMISDVGTGDLSAEGDDHGVIHRDVPMTMPTALSVVQHANLALLAA